MEKTYEKFMEDLAKVYDFSNKLTGELQSYYKCFENNDLQACENVDNFLKSINFELNDENRMAAIKKLVTLKDDFLISICDNKKLSEVQKEEILLAAYNWARGFHEKNFERVNYFIGQNELLTEFYRELLLGHYNIGLSFTKLDMVWENHISKINNDILNKFDGDNSAAVSFIHDNDLMEKFADGSRADRSYSALVEDSFEECGYSVLPYSKVFEDEIFTICSKIESLIDVLNKLEDNVFHLKPQWIKYFETIYLALSEEKCEKLIDRWRDVDFAWMDVDCPIQVGHPLEYYKDNLRNAVEIEWDLRIVNPKLNDATEIKNIVSDMYENYMSENGNKEKFSEIYSTSNKGLNNVQLYVGKPLMYHGRFFKGLFSAQVVPNDEIVSSQTGKKIFAFADYILEVEKSSPVMKLSTKVFGEDFVRNLRNTAFNNSDAWFKTYFITTIGHEFGHILWKGKESEIVMNKTGNFKNIEEYKATTGGLVAFFKSELVEEYWEEVFYDVIERAVKLIGWQKVKSVWPYYCEGLIHLTGLFESGVLSFNGERLLVDTSYESFCEFSQWTISTYEKQFDCYLNLNDASSFLHEFCELDKEKGVFMPTNADVYDLVVWYYDLYEKIGREEDKEFKD